MTNSKKIESAIRNWILALGDDPKRAELLKTPERVVNVLQNLGEGYRVDLRNLVKNAVFTVEHDQMVAVREIGFYSLCEHDLLPFFGKVHVGYIPEGRVLGMGKVPEIVRVFSRRLQIQERMSEQIADFVMKTIKPKGVGVIVEGFHLCMAMRGHEQKDAWFVTSSMKGIFRRDARTRAEFLQLVKRAE
jgi:GTP cyclohydrolase I